MLATGFAARDGAASAGAVGAADATAAAAAAAAGGAADSVITTACELLLQVCTQAGCSAGNAPLCELCHRKTHGSSTAHAKHAFTAPPTAREALSKGESYCS